MADQFPALLVVVPLIAACLTAMAGWLDKRLCFPVSLIAIAIVLAASIGIFVRVMSEEAILYRLGGWDPPFGISYYIDRLNAMVLVTVALVALINLISAQAAISRDLADRIGSVYTLYLLSVAGLLGIVATGDAFNLYVLLEIASLSGYALVALGGGPAYRASLNYVFVGTIGASFYLLGVGFLYTVTGTLNMNDLASLLPALHSSKAVLTAFIMIMAGLWLKMALFPLHGWLPNAYSLAPSAVGGLLAPLTTKVMIYVMIRMMLTIFTPAYAYQAKHLAVPVTLLATLAIFAGAIMALQQREVKRMLAYIIVAEVGYMVGGAWLGNQAGMTGAILHLINDAAMTLCVFLAVGAMGYRVHQLDFNNLSGLFAKMPWTMSGLAVGALSIIGVPPTCGFFSKWYLLTGAIEAGRYEFAAALILSSLVAVVLFFRIFELALFPNDNSQNDHSDHGHGSIAVMAEAPVSMVAPLLLTATGLIIMGLYTGPIVRWVIEPIMTVGFYWRGNG